MVETGENLDLFAEPRGRALVDGGLNDFDGEKAIEILVRSGREVDGSHPAASELTQNSVGTDPRRMVGGGHGGDEQLSSTVGQLS